MDSVIAKYSDVDRAKKPAHTWIMTVLSNHSGDSVSKKARKARLVLESIRNLIPLLSKEVSSGWSSFSRLSMY